MGTSAPKPSRAAWTVFVAMAVTAAAIGMIAWAVGDQGTSTTILICLRAALLTVIVFRVAAYLKMRVAANRTKR